MIVDIESNRSAVKWSRRELLGRFIWGCIAPFFSIVPRQFWAVRVFILRLFGAKIGKSVHIYPSVRIAVPWNLKIGDGSAIGDKVILYSLGETRIGKRCTISQYAHLCAGSHDHTDPKMPLVKAEIEIKDDSWICADAYIGPNVTVGENAIVGARSVVVKSVAGGSVVGGNPAKPIGKSLKA